MSSSNNICDNCIDKDGRVYIHMMCKACKDNALFKHPPQKEECPICFLTLPSLSTGTKYSTCCGKVICSGCIRAVNKMDDEAKCPFCRVPTPESDEEIIQSIEKRVEMDAAEAIYNLGCCYNDGIYGVPQNYDKALYLWHRAGELGCASAYNNIGNAYGRGAARDMKKTMHYFELAAIGGCTEARYNLGLLEQRAGNMSIALKHYMIAAGYDESLKEIREFYINGHATKDDYAKALRAHQKYVDGIKSDQRDKAAAFNREKYRYY